MVNKFKDRRVAAGLALAGILLPGLHKFYLGQPRWGLIYLVLGWSTPISISKLASVAEGLWYLFQEREEFDYRFNAGQNPSAEVGTVTAQADRAPVALLADAIRQLEQLRQDGLISEYEFEQKRRKLMDRIG
jgi:TM2 domain-containing membrane protein YozV